MTPLDFAITLAGFGVIHLLAVVSPGPSLIVVTRTSIAVSRNAGFMTALGFGVGSVIWALAAIFGLNILFSAVPWLYLAVKISGALYLIFLAYKLLRSKGLEEFAVEGALVPQSLVRSFLKGLFVQLSNPKVVIFMGSMLVTLLPKNPSPEMLMAVIVLIFFDEFVWYSLVAAAFSVERLRNTYRRVSKTVDRVAGVFLGGLGVRILTQ